MISYNELRDGQEFFDNGYKKGYHNALRDFAEWIKTQPIYVGRGHIDGEKE